MKKLLLAFLIMLAACSQQGAPVGPEVLPTHDRTNQTLEIAVVVHPNFADLNRQYDDWAREDRPAVYGWTTWPRDGNGVCTIHVVKPTNLGTKAVDTWGHELMHCIYGEYHP